MSETTTAPHPVDDFLDELENSSDVGRRLVPLFRVVFQVVKDLEERVEAIDGKTDLIGMAVRSLTYEPLPAEPIPAVEAEATETRLLGIPIQLRAGIQTEDVRRAYDELPRGLSSEQVVDALVNRGLVLRAPKEG